MTDSEWDAAIVAMREAGSRHGKSAGGWIADGNTSEDALRLVLQQWEDGDPAAPECSAPFSGEFADGLVCEDVIDSETELEATLLEPEEVDDLATAFEEAYYAAWQEEAERTIRAFLGK